MANSYEIPSFGRQGDLCDLYDIRTQKFTNKFIFAPKPMPSYLKKIVPIFDCPKHEIFEEISFMNRMNNFHLKPEIKVCLLSQMIIPNGSGKYLTTEDRSADTISMTILFEYQTCKTAFDFESQYEIFQANLISNENLLSDDSTHILTEITWGAKIVVTLKFRNFDKRPFHEIMIELKAKLNELVNPQKKPLDSKLDYNNFVRIFSDLPMDVNYQLWESLEKVHELIHKIPEQIKNLNDGKGVPIYYSFHPIRALQENLKILPNPKQHYNKIENSISKTILEKYETFNGYITYFYKGFEQIREYELYFTEERMNNLWELKTDLLNHVSTLQDELRKSLVSLSSGTLLVKPAIQEILDKLENFQLSNFIETIRKMKEKISFVQTVKSFNGIYVDRESYEKLLSDSKTYCKNMFIFCVSSRLKEEFESEWNANFDLYFQMMGNDKKSRLPSRYSYYVYDYELNAPIGSEEEIKIVHYKNGKRIIGNLLKAKEVCTSGDFAFTENMMDFHELPQKSSKFLFNCPGTPNRRCPNETREWTCCDCFEKLIYGFDQFVYCRCGKGLYSEYRFKCEHPGHGAKFAKFINDENSHELFKQLNEIKVKNILVLGKTGVGKSTWINAFANFFYNSTLEEAQAQTKLICPIPASFTEFDENRKAVKVRVGEEDESETLEVGKSGTIFPNVYSFEEEKYTIKLIDTPGIGDTRGIEAQKINFQNILNVLSNYSEINGILILLKPNDSRIDAMFEYCIKGLLANLHVDACKNICFVFTHGKGTRYTPGDTLSTLSELLQTMPNVEISTDNYFCMDSESFRYLAASSVGVKFSEYDISDYTRSWDISKKETQRLVEHIIKLKPHKTNGTLSLNETRNLLLQMIIPIAEITRNIFTNMELNQTQIGEINNSNLTEENLMKLLKYKAIKIEMTQLEHPISVCGNEKCIQVVTLNNVNQTNYKTICCKKCTIKFVTKEAKDQIFLYFCKQIDIKGNCKNEKCRHPRSDHLHISYRCHQKEVDVVDEEKQKEIENLQTEREKKQAYVNQLKKTIAEFEEEKKVIEDVCAKLGVFLKNNAIIPFNDSLLQYLDHVIEQEKVKGGEFSTAVIGLIHTKESYQEQFAFLEKSIVNTRDRFKQSCEIKEIVLGLFNLPKSGKNLRDIVEKAHNSEETFWKSNKKEKKVGKLFKPKNWITSFTFANKKKEQNVL